MQEGHWEELRVVFLHEAPPPLGPLKMNTYASRAESSSRYFESAMAQIGLNLILRVLVVRTY